MNGVTMKILSGLGIRPYVGVLRWLLVMAFCLPAAQVSAASVNMEGIDFTALPGGRFEVRMSFDGRPPEPKGYTIERPARIALDLADVGSNLDQKKHTLAFDNAQSVTVVEAGGRTRVILNLVNLVPYETSIQGTDMVVSVGASAAGGYAKENSSISEQYSAGPSLATSAEISSFDFQRGAEGEGKVVLELSDSSVEIDVNLEGNTIRLGFIDTGVPEDLKRRYDVSDFATPVQMIDVNTLGSQAAIDVRVSGDYDYLAYQADNTYVLSVKPLTPDEVEAKRKEFAFVGEKLSLNFQDIEVRAVLQLIADFTDLNLVASDTVAGRITLRLQNVPWDQALDLILRTKGLDKRQDGNVLMVAPAAEIAERERQEIETNKQLEELAPLQTEFIRIKYANASELFKLFGSRGTSGNVATGEAQEGGRGGRSRSQESSILSARGTVIVDERTNSLLVTETAEKLEEFRRLINLIDVPVRQVMIEARIVIASTDFSEQLGVRWGGATDGDVNGNQVDIGGNIGTVGDVFEGGLGAVSFPEALFVDLGATGQGTSSFAIGFASDDLLLRAELSALEASGNGEIVSQPKIITGDKQQASIEQGTEVPFQKAASSGETTVEFKEAVLKLDVTPHITPDDRILMKLVINQDSVGEVINGEFGSQIPTIDTTQLETEVLVGNGETIVLGGVFQTEEIVSETKTPLLGDIPYLGRLFKKTAVDMTKSETLIFITPKIISDRLLD